MQINPNHLDQLKNQVFFKGGRAIDPIVNESKPVVDKIVEKVAEEGPKLIESILKIFAR